MVQSFNDHSQTSTTPLYGTGALYIFPIYKNAKIPSYGLNGYKTHNISLLTPFQPDMGMNNGQMTPKSVTHPWYVEWEFWYISGEKKDELR